MDTFQYLHWEALTEGHVYLIVFFYTSDMMQVTWLTHSPALLTSFGLVRDVDHNEETGHSYCTIMVGY